MAKYEITSEEYQRYTHSPAFKRKKRMLMWTVSILVLVASLAIGQYAFTAFWAALLIFLYVTFYRMQPRIEKNRMTNNPFALGPFDVDFQTDSYNVRVGESNLNLSLAEFGRAHDFEDHYRLDHKSISLTVPKRALSTEEVEMIESYRERFPGYPDIQTIPDY